MKRGTKIAIGVGAALSLGLAALAGAQPGGYGSGWSMGAGMGMGMGQGMMGGGSGMMGMGQAMMGGGPGMMGMGPEMMDAQGYGIEQRLAAQKSALKITSDQESAWQAYADVAKTQADARLEQSKAMHGAAPVTAVERFDLHNKFMKEHFQQLEAVNAAFKDLYAALTPEQRAIADQGAGFGPGFRGPGGRAR